MPVGRRALSAAAGAAIVWGLWHTCPDLRGLWPPCLTGRPRSFGGWGTRAPIGGGCGARAPGETSRAGPGNGRLPGRVICRCALACGSLLLEVDGTVNVGRANDEVVSTGGRR